MRGDLINSGLRVALLLSVLLHAGIVYVASTVPVDPNTDTSPVRHGLSDGDLFAIAPADDPATPVPVPPVNAADPPAPPPTPPVPPVLVPEPKSLTAKEIEKKLVLGIAESDQRTPNWIGFAEPTEHKAKLSTVDQPQLDPNPGQPGPPAAPSMSRPAPENALAPAAATPQLPRPPADLAAPELARDGEQSPDPSKPIARTSQDGLPDGHDSKTITEPPRKGDEGAAGEKLSRPQVGPPKPSYLPTPPTPLNPDLPGPSMTKPGKNGERDALHPARPEDLQAETPRLVEPAKATAAPKQSPEHPDPRPTPPNPIAVAAPAPAQPSRPAKPPTQASEPSEHITSPSVGPASPASSPGGGGDGPGEKSTKEADASSTVQTVEIRPGHPAAAQGLEITTRRPMFTHLTRVTAYPSNPLLKVTFDRHGQVIRVVLVESSGVPDVDWPVVNAVYLWTAKGKALDELPATQTPPSPAPSPAAGQPPLPGPAADGSDSPDEEDESLVGITITVRILLR